MAKKQTKKQGKIINSKKESHSDVTAIKDNEKWEVKAMEAQSETKLEDDKGEGQAVKLFFFDYSANPAAFQEKQPTAQELFNAHLKQIEINLWSQGWSIYPDVNPRLMFAKDKTHYRFIVAGVVSKGRLLHEKPKTLTQIAHGRSTHRR